MSGRNRIFCFGCGVEATAGRGANETRTAPVGWKWWTSLRRWTCPADTEALYLGATRKAAERRELEIEAPEAVRAYSIERRTEGGGSSR